MTTLKNFVEAHRDTITDQLAGDSAECLDFGTIQRILETHFANQYRNYSVEDLCTILRERYGTESSDPDEQESADEATVDYLSHLFDIGEE